MLKYRVEIQDFGRIYGRRKIVNNISLAKAWRVVNRAARRGVKMYGGQIVRGNWGALGGMPYDGSDRDWSYRQACIYLARQ